jgi:hypothetical protein
VDGRCLVKDNVNKNSITMLAFIKAIMTFVLQPTKILKSSIPYRCDIHNFANVTRKDVLDDVFGFMAGAIAAETVISSVRFVQEVERNISIEKTFNLLDTI